MKNKNERTCICLDCIYGSQPYGYFPIVCVQGKKSKDMYHEVFKCKHFEACPKMPEPPKMKPFEVMKQRCFTSTKEALLYNVEEELKLLEQHQPPKEVVDALFDSSVKAVTDIVNKEAEIAIRLYLLQAVIENITLRESILKYKVETASTSNGPVAYTEGYAKMIQKMNGNHQLFNTYEGYVKLVSRGPVNAEEIDWKGIENDFIEFLTKGLEI